MSASRVLRDRGDERVAHVTNTELFFDLVYVFAITQISEHLFQDRSWTGALETGVIFLAVWWAWNYTAWATGWIDPERGPVVALMALLMILSLLMASAIPTAFGGRGLSFAVAYVAIQLVRSGFMVWAFGGIRDRMGRNYAQLLAWSAIAGVAWIAGGIVHGQDTRLEIWAGAVVLDLSAPMHGFWLPGVRPTPISDWTLAGGHLAERCQLVLMIAFGESVLRIGESFTQARGGAGAAAAFVLGFVLTFSLWALYFLHHAPHGSERMESAADEAARLGRAAYAYAHALMVGALILIAVAIHLAIEAPRAQVSSSFALICLGGPALFLVGLTLSKRWLGHGRMLPAALGIGTLAVLGAALSATRQLEELILAAVVAVLLGVWALLEHSPNEPAVGPRAAD